MGGGGSAPKTAEFQRFQQGRFRQKALKGLESTTNQHQPTIVAAWKASARRWIRAIGCIGGRSRGHYRACSCRPNAQEECDPARQSLEAEYVRSRGGSDRKGSASRRDSSPRSGPSSASGSIELCPCVTCLPPPVSCRKAWHRSRGLRARASAGWNRSVTPRGICETPTQKDHPPPKREDPGGYEKSLPRFLSRQAFLQL